MPETLEKLRPDRDLQCYFERPSAVAALSGAGPSGFTVSGTWRQQFDWAVIEWNRDNVFEHPAFRNLPDGDLSGLTLTYDETRSNCIPLDSDLYPTVDWPYLRIWADPGGVETLYKVRLKDHATAIEGSYHPAEAEFELAGSITAGDYVGITWTGEHHTYQIYAVDTLESAVQALVDSVNAFSPIMRAVREGRKIRLIYVGAGQTLENSTTGANGNRLGAYSFVSGAGTEYWTPTWCKFSGGTSPTKWRICLPFGGLQDIEERAVPTYAIRKMRWTYSADLQSGAYQRSEFQAQVTNWTVTGTGRGYKLAHPSSQRVEDGDAEAVYTGSWQKSKGNFSGGTIRHTTQAGASVQCQYRAGQSHTLYLGTRRAENCGAIRVVVDAEPAQTVNLQLPGEDVLVRLPLGVRGAGEHSVTVTHDGPGGKYIYFDFLEPAVISTQVPSVTPEDGTTPATDWDTDHSLALAAERTAWLLQCSGLRGRANHYVGALWFYELTREGHQYASGTVTFSGTPQHSQITEIRIGRVGQPPELDTVLQHLNVVGDTAASIAKAFELEINRGYTAIRAESAGNVLTIYARGMGTDGNNITLSASPTSGVFQAQTSGGTLAGGVNGEWRTDRTSSPRLNRAVRDWSRAYYTALKSAGIDVAAAFSMELQHGDPTAGTGIAQRYPDGTAVWLNTPALQTNFSPVSLDYWKEVYREMGQIMAEAGVTPYLQFGEVQWWYFPNASGMPFYDAYTTSMFETQYGRPMRVILTNTADPEEYAEETAFLRQLVGQFTAAIMSHVRSSLPGCRFEVLYPTDVNETALNTAVNFASGHWTPAQLECLKTESFTYTLGRNLDKAETSMAFGISRGFPASQCAFLVGISDVETAWQKERRSAKGRGMESVVLFALDQFCLIGYPLPLPAGMRRSLFQG